MNTRQAGNFWEGAAAAYLERAGVRILARNFRCSRGEIDIIGFHQGCLVFFEVKYRKDDRFGQAVEAVDIRKQERICRSADFFLYGDREFADTGVRFDVIAVCKDRVEWIQNAFDYRRTGGWNRR